MKTYNFSKKLPIHRKHNYDNASLSKKKKSKSNGDVEIKDIKREIKSLMETTALTSRNKKK